MYKTSLNQLIPTGDTSATSAETGDPTQSKTPAGVKLVAANLSIDDEDFKDNLYMTYAAVAKSMINTHFANMEGTDLMKLSDEERDILTKAGIKFPVDDQGQPSNELEIKWDEARATFDFEIDPDQDKTKDDEKRLEGLLKVAQFRTSDSMFDQKLLMSGKKLNDGELYSEIISLTTDNKKILEDVDPEDQQGVDPITGQSIEPQIDSATGQPLPPQQTPQEVSGQPQDTNVAQSQLPQLTPEDAQIKADADAVMQHYGVDENTALAMLEAEQQGFDPQDIVEAAKRNQGVANE
jgi:hypothetical protein